MNELFEQQYHKLEQWSLAALEQGWISAHDVERLAEIERQQAEALFSRQGRRPLIVAFFGGTGVGKSSLLNRLAGEQIARTGVERPTSHEVSLYLHSDYRLGQFPADLPLDETRIAYHSDDQRRLIAWLDMPDFDSVEEHHRELVHAWLPYIDWLIYVVSPDRYQDDVGWRLVQQRAGKHSWLFVMNQWDRGEFRQIEHFRLRLQQEGFVEPVILRTSCVEPLRAEDDFSQLEKTVNGAIETYGLELLQQLGVQARLEELLRVSEAFVERLEGHPMEELDGAWREKLRLGLAEVEADLLTNSRLLAAEFKQESPLPWRRTEPEVDRHPRLQPALLLKEIWNSRTETRMNDLGAELENLLVQRSIPALPYRTWLRKLRENSQGEFLGGAEKACADTLLRPGSSLRRAVCRLAGWLSWTLPMATGGWAVYHLVDRFYQGTRGEGAFLGLDYAIHSALMILLSWLLPWLLQWKLKPTLPATIIQALGVGTAAGLQRIEGQGSAALEAAEGSRKRCVDEVIGLYKELELRMEALATKLPWSR